MGIFNFDAVKSAKVLRILRKRYGLTQYEIADALGFERSKISSIESGRYKLTIEGYVRYLDFFRSKGEKITLEQLIRGEMPEEITKNNHINNNGLAGSVIIKILQEQLSYLQSENARLLDLVNSLARPSREA